jgi:hypothetical protein
MSLKPEIEAAVRDALQRCWSEKTGAGWSPDYPSYNQCMQTAVVVLRVFGGEILKTIVITCDGREVEHFYNRIAGHRYDFTRDQFNIPHCWKLIKYDDIEVSEHEVVPRLWPEFLNLLSAAFSKEYKLPIC